MVGKMVALRVQRLGVHLVELWVALMVAWRVDWSVSQKEISKVERRAEMTVA